MHMPMFAAVAATAYDADEIHNAVNSPTAYSGYAFNACSTTDVIVPTPPNDANQSRSENTEREWADQIVET